MASSFTSAGAALTTKQSFREFENKKTRKKNRIQSERLVRASSLRESTEKAKVVLVVSCCSLFFSPAQSLASSSSSFDERFSGSFADPNHPGCPREITKNGVLRGYDPVPFEKGKGCRGRKVVTPEDVFAIPGENHAVLGNPNQTGWKDEGRDIHRFRPERRERGESRGETERE